MNTMGAIILAPLYLLMNLYLAVRILLWFRIAGGLFGSTWFAAVFVVLFLTAMLSPLPAAFAQGRIKRIANRISNFWLGILMYLLIFLLLSDIVWSGFCLVTNRSLLSIFGVPAPTIREVCLLLRPHSTMGWQQSSASSIYLWIGAVILAATAGISIWGIVHARRIEKVTYPVTIHKECKLASPTLKIALVADLHLGYGVGLKRVQEVVRMINDMKPDLVVFAGDLFDNSFDAIQEPEACAAALSSIKSTYGSFACWGNHDVEERILAGFTFDSNTHKQKSGSDKDLTTDSQSSSCASFQRLSKEHSSTFSHTHSAQPKAQNASPMAQMLRTSGIQLLEDETVLIGDAFYLSGRLDASCSAHQPRSGSSVVGASCRRPQGGGISIEKKSGHIRKTPAELTTKLTNESPTRLTPSDGTADSTACSARLDPNKPFIVIDHQPSELKELAAAGADLILSGHTHDGQMFPANLITRLGWMNSYGKLEIGSATSIVTSGAGTWGPAMRIGTRNEVVEIMVTFKTPEGH